MKHLPHNKNEIVNEVELATQQLMYAIRNVGPGEIKDGRAGILKRAADMGECPDRVLLYKIAEALAARMGIKPHPWRGRSAAPKSNPGGYK